MLDLSVALAMSTLTVAAAANAPPVFVATNAERASGFTSLAECERAIAVPARRVGKVRASDRRSQRGSLFNRRAGNVTRCEMVDGEALVVVYPRGHEALQPPR